MSLKELSAKSACAPKPRKMAKPKTYASRLPTGDTADFQSDWQSAFHEFVNGRVPLIAIIGSPNVRKAKTVAIAVLTDTSTLFWLRWASTLDSHASQVESQDAGVPQAFRAMDKVSGGARAFQPAAISTLAPPLKLSNFGHFRQSGPT